MYNEFIARAVVAERTADAERVAAVLCEHLISGTAPAPGNNPQHDRMGAQPPGTSTTGDRSIAHDIADFVGHLTNIVGRALRHLPDTGYHSNHPWSLRHDHSHHRATSARPVSPPVDAAPLHTR